LCEKEGSGKRLGKKGKKEKVVPGLRERKKKKFFPQPPPPPHFQKIFLG